MKLYCVRHGEANAATTDSECGLTEKGLRDITKVGRFLSAYPLHIDHIMHSPKKRAIQTATILSENIHPDKPLEESHLLKPESDVQELVSMINTWDQDTMLVSHLPFIAQLVSALVVGDQEHFPIVNFVPGTIVCLNHYEQKRWVINWLLYPDLVTDE